MGSRVPPAVTSTSGSGRARRRALRASRVSVAASASSASSVLLYGTRIVGNVAGAGGGVIIDDGSATLSETHIISNTATFNHADTGRGGGLYIRDCSSLSLTNNVVATNQANTEGGVFPVHILLDWAMSAEISMWEGRVDCSSNLDVVGADLRYLPVQ